MLCYGNYAYVHPEEVEHAKKLLARQVIETIEAVMKEDDFWIIAKNHATGNVGVGWKMAFPHMKEIDDV